MLIAISVALSSVIRKCKRDVAYWAFRTKLLELMMSVSWVKADIAVASVEI